MNIVPLEDLEYNTTNIPDDTTPTWSATASYVVGAIRQKDNKLYESLAEQGALCEYVHEDTDPLNSNYTYTAIDGVEVADNTAVPCTLNQTVVYNRDDNTYYQFDNSTGTTPLGGDIYAVNFTTQDPSNPPNFSAITGYRHEVYTPELSPLKWKDLGFTNKYKCLDTSLSSQTVVSGDIEMSFIASKVDRVFLLNAVGSSARVVVTQTDSNEVLFDETEDLVSKNSGGTFWGYVYNDFVYNTFFAPEIPINFNVRIDITITTFGGESKIGTVGIGKSESIGGTLYGASVGVIDFSKKETNTNGETYFEEGNYKATNDLIVDIESYRSDFVYKLLIKYRATPVVFTSGVYQSLTMLGIYNNFEIILSTPTISRMSIDLESLV